MTDDDVRGLLGAYALDAVDDDERRAVERLIAEDPEAAIELASLRETASALGAARASTPPADVRDAVLSRLSATPQLAPHVAAPVDLPRDELAARRAARRGAQPWMLPVAAAVAVLLAVPGTLAWQQHERAVQAEAQAALLGDVLADPGAVLLRGEVVGGGEAVAVLTSERALLVADGLADVDGDRTYQLWAMRDGVPVPSGLLDVADGRVQALATDYRAGDGLAVSVEPAGGSDQPTTDPVLVLLPG
jgi:anti-sigma-K factor RskA